MPRTVTAGLDGSPESLAAADWAAREALLRDLPLRLVHAATQQPLVYGPLAGFTAPVPSAEQQHAAARHLLDEARARVARRHPGLRIDADEIPGQPASALLKAAEDAELLVLGSRGLSRIAGYLVGSVALSVVAWSTRPVVLVRHDGQTGEEQPPTGDPATGTGAHGDVVLGLDLHKPSDPVIEFAFDAASRRSTHLRVVHGWTLPPYQYGGDLMPELSAETAARARSELTDVLRPWQEKYPAVEVHAQATIGGAGAHLVEASRGASLVVVGRHARRAPLGTHIGPVTQALLHHAAAPVAVISHA
ncbi:universal stress protein [Streptomyces sp. NPDC006624]|uniref:universal stress protein n=1 Tax=Streptomyces sp. NPDC006624 TaxID=3154892 RepID=UPI0033AD2DDA